MIEKLRALADEYEALQKKIQEPEVLVDPKQIATIGKKLSDLEPLMDLMKQYDACQNAVNSVQEMKDDPELFALAELEAQQAKIRMEELEEEMRNFLIPRDPDDDKSVILEVRAGTGGEEAALFAAELLRMYLRYSEIQGWKTEILEKADAGPGAIKEAIVRIEGPGVYGKLKYESGGHRVQRIPETENKGRVHTSAATVAILPEAQQADITIRNEDLRIDTYRASGAGGQHVNKTDSAVRITHLPTGVMIACQESRSQQKNREIAMSMLRTKLYAAEQERLAKERGDMRSGQVGSGDRSEKIRTYNFPQDRITDHRIGENFSNLPVIMDGGINDIIETLQQHAKREQLERLAKG